MSESNENSKAASGQEVVVQEVDKLIKLNVITSCIGAGETRIDFRIKMNSPLRKLKIAFSEKIGIPVGALKFLFDGVRIHDDDTAAKLGMEPNDEIEVFTEQEGGDDSSLRG